jgi:flavin reductase (DIM6/NTAB) family NADH-FMN oxidoreductase RutF
MDQLPEWPAGTVAVLSTGAGDGVPHAIPVSTAVRRGPRELVLALSLRRESLARLREDPRCAVTILAARDLAFTAIGRGEVEAEEGRIAIVRVAVEAIQDHMQATFAIDDGVQWRWTDADAERTDAELRARLAP